MLSNLGRTGIACLLAACVGLASSPLTACPTSPAASGYILTNDKGDMRLEVRAVDAGTIRIARYRDGKLLALTDYRDGLFPVAGYATTANEEPRVTYRYEPPDPRLDLVVGASLRYRQVMRQGAEERVNDVDLAVDGEETVELGACRYRVLVLKSRLDSVGGSASNQARALYSPDLKWVLRSVLEPSNGRRIEIIYTRIEPGRNVP